MQLSNKRNLFWKDWQVNGRISSRFIAVASMIIALALLTGLAITFAAHGPVSSHLVEVGPIHPEYGFPTWYKDANGQILELCLNPAYCGFVPGDIPDANAPIAMPGNFPEEAFYWLSEALMLGATPGNGNAIITMGLEAAFANNAAINGDQIVFGRIRIRVDNLVEGGTYTVTHPFGQDVFANIGPDAGPGTTRGPGISYVEDIGIGAPGDFAGAMNSRIGPFLTWEAGAATPPGFIGDGGLTEHRVVGSPFGTNYYRIEGPNVGQPGSPYLCADPALGPDPAATTDCIETDLFILLGKLATNFGVAADQVTYARDFSGSGSVDIFAHTVSGEQIEAEGAGIGTISLNGDANGSYYGRADFAGLPPTSILLGNRSDNPPTQKVVSVVDMVTILRAEYNPVAHELTVKAISSDQVTFPGLTAVNFGPLQQSGSSITSQATFTGVTVPPQAITVVSAAGGADTEPVSILYINAGPTANDDAAFLDLGTGATSLAVAVLANDSDSDGTIDPETVTAVAQPTNGTIAIDPVTGVVTYTPNAGFLGVDSFTYTVNDNAGATSNAATVTVTVSMAANTPPVANDDTAVTDEEMPVIITAAALLANDSDANGDTLAIEAVATASANGGTITDNLDGTYTYSPAVNFFGIDSFTYTINDGRGDTATAIVTVTVNNLNDAPTAIADFISMPQDSSIIIAAADLLANDVDVDGDGLVITAVDTYSAQALEQIIEGKNPPPIVDNGDGTYTYTTPDPIFVGLDTFSYQISDGNGGTASGLVSIDVTAADVITVKKAEYRGGDWNIIGGGSDSGSIITVYLGSTTGGPIIGITEVDRFKKWKVVVKGSPVDPGGETTITIVSSGGGTVVGYPIKFK